MENLPSEEVPPEYLWTDSVGLESWWATVKDKRDNEMSGGAGEMTQNDVARELLKE